MIPVTRRLSTSKSRKSCVTAHQPHAVALMPGAAQPPPAHHSGDRGVTARFAMTASTSTGFPIGLPAGVVYSEGHAYDR